VKILYVSQYFPPEMGAPAGRAADLSRFWAADHHDVTVLTGFPNHPTGIVPPEYRQKFRRMIATERRDDVDVVRTWLFPFPNRRAYERILNCGSFFVSSSTTGMFLPRPDIVIASSPQLLVGLAGWWLARAKRVPFVFEVRDLWPESLAAVGAGSADSLLYRVLEKIAGFLYRNCDRLVVVTSAFRDYLIERWQVPPEKISVVENGVDTAQFTLREPDQNLKRKLGIEGKVVVSYIGTLGMAHGLETLLDAASMLKTRTPEVVFLIVGEGAEKEHLVSAARSRGLSNVLFVDQQARENIPAYICASDACLVLLKKSELFKTVMPTKMLEFMACGRPVILGVDGHARRIMEKANAGIFIQPETPRDLAEAVMRLAGDPVLRQFLGSNGRQHVLQHFSRQQTAKIYLELLEDLLGENRRFASVAA
jgi:glycosyltransferase involved in cell wall biosynthesis